MLLFLGGCLTPYRSRPRKPPPRQDAPSSTVEFQHPLKGARVLSRFGPRGRRHHDGIDLRKSPRGGDPIRAAAAGVVVQVRTRGGYGRQVLIRHDNGWFTRYAHLRSIHVRRGRRIREGRSIGTVGRTGRATGPHLHFEILTPKKRPVDPAPYILK